MRLTYNREKRLMNPYQTSTISYRGDVFQKKTGARVRTPVF